MKRTIIMVFLTVLVCPKISSQNTVKGRVLNADSGTPIAQVTIKIQQLSTQTDPQGYFILHPKSNGTYSLTLSLTGYQEQQIPLELKDTVVNIGTILFSKVIHLDPDNSTINLTDDELSNDSNAADNISGLLQSSKDVFLQAAAFEFSSSFFKVRGLDSKYANLLINGIEMNKIYSGRPQWSNWGGLNAVLRNQVFTEGLHPSTVSFGGILGSTNIDVRASHASPGIAISYASSNRSYVHRIMVSYASGLNKKGWAYTLSASRRAGNTGYVNGTFYNASSLFIAVEKQFNKRQRLNFSAIITPNKRGKSSPNTQEVYDLKGGTYNSYWGLQHGKLRNSRSKEIVEPIFILNHYWSINNRIDLQSNIAYQTGKIGNTRIDYNGSKIDDLSNGIPIVVSLGGANPDPSYYQHLPSYGLRQGYPNIYEIEQTFVEKGQLDWKSLYSANSNSFNDGNSSYVLYEDRNDDTQLTINSILNFQANTHASFNAAIQYRSFRSDNFARIVDLLGGIGFLDVDTFSSKTDEQQNDLQHPNRIAKLGERFKYHYLLSSKSLDGFAQTQFSYYKIDFFAAASFSNRSYQREGYYLNGKFTQKNESLGHSKTASFLTLGLKVGGTYKLSGRHFLQLNLGFRSNPPTLQNTFSNPRVTNLLVSPLQPEKILTADASYLARFPGIQAKVTAYFVSLQDATEVSFYYADGLGGSGTEYTAFVQQILTGIAKQHIGIEFGFSAQVTPTIQLKLAGNLGQYTYANNPILSLQSDALGFQFDSRPAYLKNYKLATGPQQAYSVGFQYRDPNYWWIGTTLNFFSHTYAAIAPLTRTSNFSDDGGVPFNDYDPDLARQLLKQEKFSSYQVINLNMGKSWKRNQYYFSVFASVQNLLNTQYKTGGFEQGRNANYRELRDDKALTKPVFGNKYWFGRGTTYYLNLNFKF